jgi:hypothetical protein
MVDRLKPWILPLGIALAACVPFYPPPGAIEIAPPSRFERLYAEMEACTGRDGDFDRVTWWMVPGYAFRRDAWLYEALWSPGHHIVLTAWNAFQNDALIRHEIAHDLGFDVEDHADPLMLRCTGRLDSTLSRRRAR